jgi:hypothetical protein
MALHAMHATIIMIGKAVGSNRECLNYKKDEASVSELTEIPASLIVHFKGFCPGFFICLYLVKVL